MWTIERFNDDDKTARVRGPGGVNLVLCLLGDRLDVTWVGEQERGRECSLESNASRAWLGRGLRGR